MPKKPKQRERVTTDKAGPRDPMQGRTRAGRKRAKGGKKGGGTASPTDRAQCSAHTRSGNRCSNPPVRGATVCRMHGGSAPQVKAKANQRLIEMVLPAMRELRKILDSKTASDADKLKAVGMVLQRTGFNERHRIDIGLRESTPFDELQRDAFVILRGRENVIDGDEPEALPSGGGEDDEALGDFLDQRERDKQREASTHLPNDGHDVVEGAVVQDPLLDADLFGYPKSRAQKLRESGAPTEFNPDPHRPDEEPYADYERRVAEAQDPPSPGKRPRGPVRR